MIVFKVNNKDTRKKSNSRPNYKKLNKVIFKPNSIIDNNDTYMSAEKCIFSKRYKLVTYTIIKNAFQQCSVKQSPQRTVTCSNSKIKNKKSFMDVLLYY